MRVEARQDASADVQHAEVAPFFSAGAEDFKQLFR